MNTASASGAQHRWAFSRIGGVDQVVFRDGKDLEHLHELDQALWLALAMPVKGTEFDEVTAAFLDRDGDGRILPEDLLAAIEWAKGAWNDLTVLIRGGDTVLLSDIKDRELLHAARRILADLGKGDADRLMLEDVTGLERIYASARFNGDGVITEACTEVEASREAIRAMMETVGSTPDRSGQPGVNGALVEAFFAQASAYVQWLEEPVNYPAPLDAEKTMAALDALQAVRAKVDDFFVRCRLAAFDPQAPRSPEPEAIRRILAEPTELTMDVPEMAALPLASVGPDTPLPLTEETLNPAWAGRIAALAEKAVQPLLGADKKVLTEQEWLAVQARLQPFESRQQSRPVTAVESLGQERLKALPAGGVQADLAALIERDLELEKEYAQVVHLEKLVRFQRDLYRLLCNYVNFSEFYDREKHAVFQAGRLYLDARVCTLCVEVLDAAKHAALAGHSGAYLIYCALRRPGAADKQIAAVVTDGDSDGLMAGRNGIFYDQKGLCWDATITRVAANPISLREAFWMPYKKVLRFIEEQVAKRALAAEKASGEKLTGTVTSVSEAGGAAKPPLPGKIDLGTIALIGAAVGGMSALVGGLLEALFGLGFWLPLGIAGILLLISGPSMLLAWLKLRKRNLGPILDANGWAINTRALINAPFGASMTRLAELPPRTERLPGDPYGGRKTSWVQYVILLVLCVLLAVRLAGPVKHFLSDHLRCGAAAEETPQP